MISAHNAEKAHRLLEENRVGLVTDYEDRGAVVCGDSSWHTVKFYPAGVNCSCGIQKTELPDAEPRCSHALAAMVAWREWNEHEVGG